jgi:hypothetical protein
LYIGFSTLGSKQKQAVVPHLVEALSTAAFDFFQQDSRSAKSADVAAALTSVSAVLSPANPQSKKKKRGLDNIRHNDDDARTLAESNLTRDIINAIKKTQAKSEERCRMLSILVGTFSLRQLNDFVFNGTNVTKNNDGVEFVSNVTKLTLLLAIHITYSCAAIGSVYMISIIFSLFWSLVIYRPSAYARVRVYGRHRSDPAAAAAYHHHTTYTTGTHLDSPIFYISRFSSQTTPSRTPGVTLASSHPVWPFHPI